MRREEQSGSGAAARIGTPIDKKRERQDRAPSDQETGSRS
jgi:hypothetical protein